MTTRNPEELSDEPDSWASRPAFVVGVVMILLGALHVLEGIAALGGTGIFLRTSGDDTFSVNLTAWGWIFLVIGVVCLAVGFGVLAQQGWGIMVGIVVAVASAVASFLFLPYFPLWAIVTLVVDLWAVWALTRELGSTL